MCNRPKILIRGQNIGYSSLIETRNESRKMTSYTAQTGHDAATVMATIKHLNSRLRKIAPHNRAAHFQMAKDKIKRAKWLAECNTEVAIGYLWDARNHVQHCEALYD